MQPYLTNSKTLKSLAIIALLLFSISSNAQVNVLWESRYTGAGQNSDAGKEIVVDAAGNVYVVGTTYTNSTNGFDIITIKYDPTGNQLWSATFNGSASSLDEGRDIGLDANGNVYVTGYTASTGPNYNYITIKYNSTGAQQWANTYNGSANGFDEAYALVIDNLNNIYVTGGSDVTSQGTNFTTIKYNAAGAQQWVSLYNGPGNSIDAATQITLDAAQNVYVAGHSFGSGTDLDFATIKYNAAGAQQWVSRFNNSTFNFFDVPEALFVDNLNNVYVAGASYGGIATENDFATIKYNSAGAQQWARIHDGPLNDEDKAFDVVVDQNQNVYVAGRSMGTGGTAENMLTIKYNSAGTIVWQDTYDGPASGYDDAQQMRLGNSGALYVTGYSAGNGTNNDYLTLKYDTLNGNITWEARFDGPASNNDQAFAMEIDATESIYVTGTSNDPATGQDISTIKWCQLTANAGNDVAICIGSSTTLNASAAGGTTYNWLPTTGLSDDNVATPLANPTTTTTYVVAIGNGLGCVDYDTMTVTVNPLPLTTINTSGPTTFCMGDSVILSAVNLGSYVWSPTNEASQSITVQASGSYSVVITDSNSCMNTGSQTVTVNNLPNVNAGSDANLCNGDSLILNATGALNYTWNTQTTLSDSTIASPFAFPTTPTQYWVTGEDINNCTANDTVNIAISISPVADITNSSVNDTLDLSLPNGGDIQFFSSLSTNAIGFNWDFGDLATSTTPNPIHTYVGVDVYTVTLIASNGGCLDTAYTTIVVIEPISIEENELSNSISLYPNPSSDYFYINFKDIANQTSSFKIYNAIGDVVESSTIKISSNSPLKFNTSDLENGFYIFEVIVNDQKITKRFSVVN